MLSFKPSDNIKSLPVIQMTSLIDILFVCLAFFMALFLHFNFESSLNISVPQAASASDAALAPEEIVINIGRDGTVVVNQHKMTLPQLASLLQRTSALYPGQAVIVRADQKTYHEYVVGVLDACARAKIWNISFATSRQA